MKKYWLMCLLLVAQCDNAQPITLKTQEVAGITLQSFGAFTLTPDSGPDRKEIVESASYQAQSGDMLIAVDSVEYRQGVTISLSGAAIGAVNAVSQMPEIESHKERSSPTTVSTLEAKKVEYSAMAGGKDLRMDLLVFARGQHMWTVHVISENCNPKLQPVIDKIIESVRIK